jgi:UDP-GlcNAc:undecaprenyl-phosphate/decaprenyl-phosphate GlcNAc-1-phosphate transferase
MECLLSCGLTLPVTVLMIILLRAYAPGLGLVDAPGGRKEHHGEVPLVGGLAMFGGLAAAVLAAGELAPGNAALLAALGLLVVSGYLDDRHDLRPRLRFLIQAVAVLMMIYWGGVRLDNLGNLFGTGDVILGRWAVPMTIFGVLGVISALNMIDGVDGLAGALAMVALLAFGGFALATGALGDTLLLPLIFAVAGFMLFNARTPWRSRASVFMGEAGSVLLGFSLAWYAVDFAAVRHAFTPITAVWILAIPLMDTISLMLRRALKGQSPFAPDREHLHHILLRAGFTHGQTVAVALVLSVLLAAIGIAGWWLGVPEYVMFYSFIGLFALYLYGVMHAWKLMKAVKKVHAGMDGHASELRPVK